MLTLSEAKNIVLENLGEDTEITASIEYQGDYLFIAIRPDTLEGRFDPFFKVNKQSGDFIDFSPQEYDNPREIIDPLLAQTK